MVDSSARLPLSECPDRGHFAYGRREKGWGASKTLSFLREDGEDRTLKLRDQVLTLNCQKPGVHNCNEHQGKVVAEGVIHRELRRWLTEQNFLRVNRWGAAMVLACTGRRNQGKITGRLSLPNKKSKSLAHYLHLGELPGIKPVD